MLTIQVKGSEYELATTLRVAYKIQESFNHKPYMEVFQGIQTMTLENQIKMLYIAFDLKNPNTITQIEFFNEMLDNGGIHSITTKIAAMIEAITFNGLSPEEVEKIKKQNQMSQNPEQA